MMLEKLTPEELEAWKKKRRGLDTSMHLMLASQSQGHHRQAVRDLAQKRRAQEPALTRPKPTLLPQVHLRRHDHAA